MSVVNGMLANQTTFNNAFMSRTAATTSTVAKMALNNPDSTSVVDTQSFLGEVADTVGQTEGDATRKDYSSQTYITNGDSHKEALGKLDAQLDSTQTDLDAAEVTLAGHEGRIGVLETTSADHETRIDTLEANNTEDVTLTNFGSVPNAQGASLVGQQLQLQPASDTQPGGLSTGAQSIAGTKTFTGDVVVQGDLTVQGNSFKAQTTDMEVEDQNITANKGGNDATAEGGGLTIERTSTNAGIQFDSSLASKWKLGLIGALYEVIVSGIAQTIVGAKTFTNNITAANLTGTNSGDITLAAVGATPNANGASLTGQQLNLQPASSAQPGVVATAAQEFAGDKRLMARLGLSQSVDAASTGTGAAPTLAKSNVVFTNGTLSSIEMFASPYADHVGLITNNTGTSVILKNLTGGTAANQIKTPLGADYTWANQETLLVFYDSSISKWRIAAINYSAAAGASNKSVFEFVLNGQPTTTITGLDGFRRFPFNAKITNVIAFQEVQGSSGSDTFDVQVKVGAGAWTSILTTKPSIASTATADVDVGIGETGTGLTAAVLSTNPYLVSAGDKLRVNLDAFQGGTPNTMGVLVIYEPQ